MCHIHNKNYNIPSTAYEFFGNRTLLVLLLNTKHPPYFKMPSNNQSIKYMLEIYYIWQGIFQSLGTISLQNTGNLLFS